MFLLHSSDGGREEIAVSVDGSGFGMVVDPAAFRDVEDLLLLRVETHPSSDELVLLSVDERTNGLGGGDVADEVEGESVAFSAHEGVFDEVWGWEGGWEGRKGRERSELEKIARTRANDQTTRKERKTYIPNKPSPHPKPSTSSPSLPT